LQLRARAIEAVHAYDAVVLRTHPLVKERETLLQTVEQLTALSDLLTGRIEPLRVLERLTTALPDDTALQGFTLRGQKLTLNGLTGNASALMQLLGQQPGMREVRAPSAATRTGGANSKENFVIELTLDPQEFGVAMATPAPSSSPPPPSATAPAQAAPVVPTPTAAAGTPAAAPAMAKPPAPAADARVPVFGGSPPQPVPSPAKPAPATPERKGAP
ncbi:MAG: PilN domain-containing protein, partial [Alicycliphilus denitrificans]|nr:PilN domain-containing protein [Alicycliphilus denitrificans]